eukprot:NODE_747_length_4248_cov_1.500121.p3 type:complete len:111 gc:universal NODE_747_length_4248_cov_1.500121:1587-1255(-)
MMPARITLFTIIISFSLIVRSSSLLVLSSCATEGLVWLGGTGKNVIIRSSGLEILPRPISSESSLDIFSKSRYAINGLISSSHLLIYGFKASFTIITLFKSCKYSSAAVL